MTGRGQLRIGDYFEHMIEAITRIEKYVERMDHPTFIENAIVQDAVLRNIEIIGEAANNITKADNEFAGKHPYLKLEQAYKMRNALAQNYYSVNLLTVWNTVKNDLPVLKKQILELSADRGNAKAGEA